ncbi:MAG: YajQ family cyclic di-GMP-binding protein [Planctomycetes bacterium]|nr:YajQ family cyclic di-GMP-binding protein [Planctomycetota bacterium]
MPSFDIVSKVDFQELDNALNNTRKAIEQRYDFRGVHTEITVDKKEKKLHVVTGDRMKMEAVKEMLLSNASKRKLDTKVFEFKEPEPTTGASLKRDIKIREGIDHDLAKKIVKMIKDTKMKVQVAIQGEELRVSGKKIDDLQEVIQFLRGSNLEVPLQFVNMKS